MQQQWDGLVDRSRNGTFLFKRAYMDYHADRFRDISLIISRDGDSARPVALLAAAVSPDGSLVSHGGLSYGGLIMDDSIYAPDVLEIFSQIKEYYRSEGFAELRYKAIPHIYHNIPAEEDIYALFRNGARLVETNISSVINLSAPLPFSRTQRYHANRAEKSGIIVDRSDDYAAYWELLSALLDKKYSTRPVHTLDEITLLASRFPDNIRLYLARSQQGEVLAGSVIYLAGRVAHAQYIGASEEGKRRWALPLLFRHAIAEAAAAGMRYFDFGTSNEDHGHYLNEGLITQKSQLGGRGIAYNIYSLPL